MIEFIIIFESVISCIIRRIYIDQFHFSCKVTFETMESEEIISLDYEIIFYRTILISCEFLYTMLAVLIYPFRIREDLLIEKPIDIIASEYLIIKNLISFRVFLILSSCKNAVFIRETQYYFIRIWEEFSSCVRESDLIFETRITIREELFIIHETDKFPTIKNNNIFDFDKKYFSRFFIIE